MKLISILFFVSLNFYSCISQKGLTENCKSIKIEFVDLYVMTPVNVTLENFHQYFGDSINSITIKDRATISKTIEKLNTFFNSSAKAELLPDTRLIITLYYENTVQVITMGTTLLNSKGQSYISNDSIRQYFGKLTNNEW